MNPTFRPLTIKELLFDEPVKLNVPYSILPQYLPEIATAPVATPAPLKLTAKQIPAPSFLSKTGKFMENNWLLILIGICIGAAVIYSKHLDKKKRKKSINLRLQKTILTADQGDTAVSPGNCHSPSSYSSPTQTDCQTNSGPLLSVQDWEIHGK